MKILIKRSIMLDGHKTSVSLEDAFWTEFKQIAHFQHVTVSSLVEVIAAGREQSNLSSAIRVFVLEHFQNKHKPANPPHFNGAPVNSDEGQSTQAWRGLEKRG